MENQKIISEIMEQFKASDLSKLELQTEALKLKLERASASVPATGAAVSCVPAPAAQAAPSVQASPAQEAAPSERAPLAAEKTKVIKAPLVGTFYAAPAPDAAPFVSEGQKVKKGEPMCILEAMKMMNELNAPYDLIVTSVLGVNGEMAQFDQALFEVEEC